MWKPMVTGSWVAMLGLSSLAAFAGQEKQDKKEEPTQEEIVKDLDEIHKLMEQSEELLQSSSLGKAAAEQKELMEKIDKLLGETKNTQKSIMDKIAKLMGKTEGAQKDTIDKLAKLIKKVKEQGGDGSSDGQPEQGQPQDQQQKNGQPQTKQNPGKPATQPYNPNRPDNPNALKQALEASGRWGDLPPRLRDQISQGEMDIDKYPAEYRDLLEGFFKELMKEGGK